jgi:hypothetical protein
MIFRRKSFHTFRNVGNESISENELNDIQNAYSELAPLNPEIKTAIRIVPEKETNCKRGGEYCILFYSEKKDGYLQNIGYIGEQLDLYLVSRNIGTLWLGIGKTKEEHFENMEFVIMFSIRKISDSSILREIIISTCKGINGFDPVTDLYFVYNCMYNSSSLNVRNECIHGRGYETQNGLHFALRITLISILMIEQRIQIIHQNRRTNAFGND